RIAVSLRLARVLPDKKADIRSARYGRGTVSRPPVSVTAAPLGGGSATAARLVDHAIAFLALLACMSFVVSLRDVALRRLEVGPSLPAPPEGRAESDAELRVEVLADPGGEAVSDASVRIFWERAGKFYLAGSGRSNPRGSAVFHRLPRGVVWVLVDADGKARSSTQLVLGGDARIARVLLG